MTDKIREAFAAGAAAQREAAAKYIEATDMTELLKSGDKQMIQTVYNFLMFYSNGVRNMKLVVGAYAHVKETPSLQPIGWIEGPYGEFRHNPDHKLDTSRLPQSAAWSIPVYADITSVAPQRDTTDPDIQTLTLQAEVKK